MTATQHRLNDRMYYVLEPCPEKHREPLSPAAAENVTRMSIYVDEQKMMIWDIYLTDDIRYEANLEVDPSFRNGEWMSLLIEAEPGSLEAFSRPNAVWANTGTIIIEQEQALAQFHKTMTERGIMRTERIFAHGSLNKIIPII